MHCGGGHRSKKIRSSPELTLWYKVASLWGCTVREAQERCTWREFIGWAAFYETDPWGHERSDLHAGIVASTIANAMRQKRGRSFKPRDFMPNFGTRGMPAKQSPQQLKASLKQFTTILQSKNKKISNG